MIHDGLFELFVEFVGTCLDLLPVRIAVVVLFVRQVQVREGFRDSQQRLRVTSESLVLDPYDVMLILDLSLICDLQNRRRLSPLSLCHPIFSESLHPLRLLDPLC